MWVRPDCAEVLAVHVSNTILVPCQLPPLQNGCVILQDALKGNAEEEQSDKDSEQHENYCCTCHDPPKDLTTAETPLSNMPMRRR